MSSGRLVCRPSYLLGPRTLGGHHATAQTLFVTNEQDRQAHIKHIFGEIMRSAGAESNRRVLAMLAYLRY